MIIKGKFIYLKTLNIRDSKFIYNLRKKKNVSLFLHKPPKSINFQKSWIINNLKDKKSLDFVIFRKKNKQKLGTICFDNIKKNSAEWGRWISLGNIIENIESVILLLNFGFNKLNLKKIYSLTNVKNKKVVNFHNNTTALYGGIIKLDSKNKKDKMVTVKYSFTKKRFKDFKKKFIFMTESIQ